MIKRETNPINASFKNSFLFKKTGFQTLQPINKNSIIINKTKSAPNSSEITATI
jgi:hypothetical protein